MPFKAKIGQRLDLGDAFLHVVLAKGMLAGGRRLSHGLGRPGLADGQQANARGITPGVGSRPGNAGDKVLEAAGKA
ncbi:hypothetical protein GCM10007933_18420 [Zoogloea oryzae]|uniref:Uncharacterized protein n=1 Tax=Zoogloea oryzae TaxID=310767 RepID=A0ABQ6FA12_9RHOO|nr:hypothetical protein GCM10007933_18420 [Zoogloea oryzae]